MSESKFSANDLNSVRLSRTMTKEASGDPEDEQIQAYGLLYNLLCLRVITFMNSKNL
jgi:hypothetical protein